MAFSWGWKNYVSRNHKDCDTNFQPLTYASTRETQIASGTFFINTVMPQELPHAAEADRLTGVVNHIKRDGPSWHIYPRRPQKRDLTKVKDAFQLSTTQRCYKQTFDRRVRQNPTLTAGDYVFKSKTTQGSIASASANEMGSPHYFILLHLTFALHNVLNDKLHFATIDEDAFWNPSSMITFLCNEHEFQWLPTHTTKCDRRHYDSRVNNNKQHSVVENLKNAAKDIYTVLR